MEMENSSRSFERSREIGLKKPRLTEESNRDMNQSSHTFQQRLPMIETGLSSSRLKVGEIEDSNVLVSYEQHQHDLVDRYRTALKELTFNSKPIITNLTIIAGENLHIAKAISATVCANILEVSTERKLPSLYLLDSIAKNIGKDYIEHFAAKLPEVFCKAYRQVDSLTHQSMQHLFGTWLGVFSLEPLQNIENELGFNTIFSRASSTATSSRSDFQPQRPPHSIHVNPKYLEARQRFQNNQVSSNKDTREEPVNEKEARASCEDSDDGRGPGSLSRSLGLGLQRGGGLDDPRQENNKKRYRGGESMPAIPPQSNGLAGKPRLTNYSQTGDVQTDVFTQNNQIRENKSGIATLKSWKNSEEEEYTWNDPGMNDKQSFPMKENRVSGYSGISEFEKSHGKQRNLPKTDYNIEPDVSTYSLSTSNGGQAFHPNHSLMTRSKNDTRFRDDPMQFNTRSRNVIEEKGTMDGSRSDFLPKTSKPIPYSKTPNTDLPNVRTEISGQRLPPTHEATMSSFHKTPSSLPFSSHHPNSPDGISEDDRTRYQPGISGKQSTTHKTLFPSPHTTSSSLPFSSHHPKKHDDIPENYRKLYPPLRGFDPNDAPISKHMNSGQIHLPNDSTPLQTDNLYRQRSEKLRSQDFHCQSKSHYNLKNQVPYSSEIQSDMLDYDQSTDVRKLPLATPSSSSLEKLKQLSTKFDGSYISNASVMKNRLLSNSSVTNRLQDLSFQDMGSVSHQQPVQPSPLPLRHPLPQFTSSRPMASEAPFPSHESLSNISESSDHSQVKRQKQSSFLSGQAASASGDNTSRQNSNADSKSATPISSLLNKLMAEGLISPSKPEVSDTSPLPTSRQKLSESSGAADICSPHTHNMKRNHIPSSAPDYAFSRDLKTPAFLEPGCEDFKNVIGLEFRPKIIREFHRAVVDDLFEDLPHTCCVCSRRMRFRDQLERHMGWHDLNGVGIVSRRWYSDSYEWMKPPYLLESEPNGVETAVGEAKDLQMVPADESQCVCFFCGEIFKDFYSFERDEWMFKDAVYMEIPSEYRQHFGDGGDEQGTIVHTYCVSDATFELEKQMEMLDS